MTEAESAWLAGLFEGEGSFTLTNANTRWGGKTRTLKIAMTDLDVLQKAQRVSGAGQIKGPWKRHERYKPIWVWQVTRWPDIKRLIEAMAPWLCSRRSEKAREMLANPAREPGGLKRTHCVRGHEKNEENTYVYKNQRHCRPCRIVRRDLVDIFDTRELKS